MTPGVGVLPSEAGEQLEVPMGRGRLHWGEYGVACPTPLPQKGSLVPGWGGSFGFQGAQQHPPVVQSLALEAALKVFKVRCGIGPQLQHPSPHLLGAAGQVSWVAAEGLRVQGWPQVIVPEGGSHHVLRWWGRQCAWTPSLAGHRRCAWCRWTVCLAAGSCCLLVVFLTADLPGLGCHCRCCLVPGKSPVLFSPRQQESWGGTGRTKMQLAQMKFGPHPPPLPWQEAEAHIPPPVMS
ncbi:hypothetical protein E2C01_002088 [Portunus trituberculatus]|uniref:Uncharacterized protein n=1 Tax=Portunus trituberculatus TaxID=210409 RepID=A0A5B7CJM1_PORTR|nr:hypothetical protein [Portunus trituberculatus]